MNFEKKLCFQSRLIKKHLSCIIMYLLEDYVNA
jgi:hypothetical protein